jgi:hypothetical protein
MIGLFPVVSNRQHENAAQLTYTADPAAFMEGAAHTAYFTDTTKVMRERLKRSNKSAREAYRKSIFGRW